MLAEDFIYIAYDLAKKLMLKKMLISKLSVNHIELCSVIDNKNKICNPLENKTL